MSYSPISTSDALTQLTAEETLEFDQVIADGVTHSVSDFATKEDLFALFLTAGTVYVRNTQNAGVWYPIGDNIASNVATATKIVDSLNGVNTNVMTLTKNLTPAMEAALTNSGANVGSTALAPITNTELVVQSTGKTLQVTTKGILTKVPYAKALTAGAAAIGVGLGIGFVEVNPELATKISNRMFGTDIDPGDISNVVENTTAYVAYLKGISADSGVTCSSTGANATTNANNVCATVDLTVQVGSVATDKITSHGTAQPTANNSTTGSVAAKAGSNGEATVTVTVSYDPTAVTDEDVVIKLPTITHSYSSASGSGSGN